MSIVLLIIAVIILVAVGFFAAIAISMRRQGGFATKLLGRLFGSGLGRKLAGRASKRLLADDDSLTMDNVHRLMASNPELIEQMAAQQGVDPAQAREALSKFSSLDVGAQRKLISRAQAAADGGASTSAQIAAAVGPLSASRPHSGDAAARAAKRKAAARARTQQAKQKRR
jgi:amino acid transporter